MAFPFPSADAIASLNKWAAETFHTEILELDNDKFEAAMSSIFSKDVKMKYDFPRLALERVLTESQLQRQ